MELFFRLVFILLFDHVTATGVTGISFCIGLNGTVIEIVILSVILHSLNRSVPLNATFAVIL